METIISTALGSLTTLVIGYLVGKLKTYKRKTDKIEDNNKLQNEAIMMLLQNNLTNQYFVYEPNKELYDYQYRNWLNQLKIYENLGGDDFIHELSERMHKFKIIKTNILK